MKVNNLYLLKHKDGKTFKIGRTIRLEKRFQELSRYFEFDWLNSLYFSGENSDIIDLEILLHKSFKKYNIKKFGDGGTEFFDMKCYTSVLEMIEFHLDVMDFEILNEKNKIDFRPKPTVTKIITKPLKEVKRKPTLSPLPPEFKIKMGRRKLPYA